MAVDSRIPNIDRIRELQRGLTQEQFCDKCGISRQTLVRIYGGHRVELDPTLLAIAAAFAKDPAPVRDVAELMQPEPSTERLCDRISRQGLWPQLMDAFRHIVIISGTSAMRTYTEDSTRLVSDRKGHELIEGIVGLHQDKNPTVSADVEAALVGIRAADLLLKPFAGILGCGVSYTTEELIKYGKALKPLLGEIGDRIHGASDFFGFSVSIMRTFADPLDGSMNHERGIHFFCSAAALLVDDQPRASAIFDPVHNVVCSAALIGPYDRPERQRIASEWAIGTGHSVDLVEMSRRRTKRPSGTEGVAIHLPRRDSSKRREMIEHLPDLAETFDSVYMFNAGIPAMTLVAKGGLAAFANPWTNLHDVAAAEVLCRATDCVVTDWRGDPIRYNNLAVDAEGEPISKTSLLVARREVHAEIMTVLKASSLLREGATL
jgi:fructose-1,6-bisphosphatase/inositol monophosphatase family enzyme/transcriptional regulator with XRE-family HTH domain